MSTSGIYNYWPKVTHPNAILPQTTSDGFQTPFYFGGSQVPINLNIATGSGIYTPYISHTNMKNTMSAEKRGTGLTTTKNLNIHLPKYLKTVKY